MVEVNLSGWSESTSAAKHLKNPQDSSSVLNRYWRCLLIPLLAVVLCGTAAQTREVLEEEPPILASGCGFAAVRARLRRAAPQRHSLPKSPQSASGCFDISLDRPAVAIAPHGRPDNTRGDPVVV